MLDRQENRQQLHSALLIFLGKNARGTQPWSDFCSSWPPTAVPGTSIVILVMADGEGRCNNVTAANLFFASSKADWQLGVQSRMALLSLVLLPTAPWSGARTSASPGKNQL